MLHLSDSGKWLDAFDNSKDFLRSNLGLKPSLERSKDEAGVWRIKPERTHKSSIRLFNMEMRAER